MEVIVAVMVIVVVVVVSGEIVSTVSVHFVGS